ncbi:MAG TPA: threonine synthase [Vicinamibacterales bacterium]|nr:threonine synthase [Vicinamibacterales bacterium]
MIGSYAVRFVSTRGAASSASLGTALFDGLAPDGGLYVPDPIDPWLPEEISALPSMSLSGIGVRTLRPFARGIDARTLTAIVGDALDFPIPLVEVEPGIYSLELFHGPTLAFKDVGARVMARLMAALGGDVTVLTATSGDTGSAVANAFHGIASARVVILYPEGRVSPTQEAQLTMFNDERDGNVRGYAIAGSFDDCQRLVKEAFADRDFRKRVPLTSANSINVGRLLPQMVYYFQAVAELKRKAGDVPRPIVCTPSGNFGNLTAGLMAKRAGAPIARFVAATNVNDVVPQYLMTGSFQPRASLHTIANAMDVGNPSNFERMMWLYGNDVDALRKDITGSVHEDVSVKATIKDVFDRTGYLLDPHSAIGYLGIKRTKGIFLATAHPAKFSEIVEPVIGRTIDVPAPLAKALEKRRKILKLDATLDAVKDAVKDAVGG